MSQTAGPNIHLGFISRLESIRIRINRNEDQNQDCNGIRISKIKFRIKIRIRTRMKTKLGLSSSSGGELQSAKGQSCCKGQFVDLIRHLVQHFQVHLFNKVFTDFTQLCLFNSLTCALSRILTDLDQTWFGLNSFLAGGDHQGDFYKKCFWENLLLGKPGSTQLF